MRQRHLVARLEFNIQYAICSPTVFGDGGGGAGGASSAAIRRSHRWRAKVRFFIRRCVGEVEDAYGLGIVQIHKGLAPPGSIDDRTHAPDTRDPTPMAFARRKVTKGGAVHTPREVRAVGGHHDRAVRRRAGWLHLTDSQRVPLRPLAVDERDHGPIHAQDERVRGAGRVGMLVKDAGRCGCFMRDECGPRRFGTATGRIGMHLGTGEPRQLASGFGKRGAMRAQAHQGFLKPWGQAAGQQPKFVIEGEKARPYRPGSCRSTVLT